ncbi:MAG: hypothetical protein BWX64_02030 [Acidobacteria bacterium ADurb.Bin051]|nr:MAG: hypothetical protein BWX64_02030 [Acidobacteria bacterium ADurb.Bin051]
MRYRPLKEDARLEESLDDGRPDLVGVRPGAAVDVGQRASQPVLVPRGCLLGARSQKSVEARKDTAREESRRPRMPSERRQVLHPVQEVGVPARIEVRLEVGLLDSSLSLQRHHEPRDEPPERGFVETAKDADLLPERREELPDHGVDRIRPGPERRAARLLERPPDAAFEGVLAPDLPGDPSLHESDEVSSLRDFPVLPQLLPVAEPLHVGWEERGDKTALSELRLPIVDDPARQFGERYWAIERGDHFLHRRTEVEGVRPRAEEACPVRGVLD